MNSDVCDNDADSWLNLKSRLRQALDRARPQQDQWRYNPNLDVPREEAETHWLAECQRYRIAVRDSVDVWICTGSIDEPHEEVRFFLAARFDAAHDLVASLTFVKNSEWTTIFPFPKKSPDDVLRFLLTDWWDGWGQFAFFRHAYDQKMIR